MPDEELFRLASQGKLNDAATLRGQVDRLLAGKRSQAFVSDFLRQWSCLYKIHANASDKRLYWEHDELLGNSLVQETERFFVDLIERNLPTEYLIDSDFTFLDRRLASCKSLSSESGFHWACYVRIARCFVACSVGRSFLCGIVVC